MTLHPIVEEDITHICRGLTDDAARLSGKTMLISGGAGFLGSYVTAAIEHLNATVLDEPCRMIVLDNYATGTVHSPIGVTDLPNVEFRRVNVQDPIEIDEPVDFILHMAGIASPHYYRKQPIETIQGIVWGANNLLELARVKKPESFLVFSSSEIYGDPDPANVPTPETYRGNVAPIGPRACYDEAKRLCEALATSYWDVHGVPVRIVRPFNVFGPGMKPDDYRVMPSFIMHAMAGEPLIVYGTGQQTRTFCYVRDAIGDFIRILLRGQAGEAYNVGNPEGEIAMAELARLVTNLVKSTAGWELHDYAATYPGDEPMRRCPDISKLQNHLGASNRTPLEEGLNRTVEWFQVTYEKEALRMSATPQ